jgi:imidazolonepropionase-like amidohydrolase
MRALLILLTLLALSGTLFCRAQDLVLRNAKIYESPSRPPLEHGTVLVHGENIAWVGSTSDARLPREARVIDCTGMVITAGFWNSHVHILTPGLIHADRLSPNEITAQLQAIFTQWGFTTVFDIASVLKNTNLIRERIATGESQGPRILTTGEPFWIKTPIYVQSFLKANDVYMPETHSIPEAIKRVKLQVSERADGVKIFANSVEDREILTMPLDMAEAIVREAHAHGKPVFAHVSNNSGIEVALHSGVDVLAHTTPIDKPWTPAFVKPLVAAHMALTPTLTLWEFESRKGSVATNVLDEVMMRAANQLNAFFTARGDVLFGTDVGYTDIFDTTDEFKWMSRAGMSYKQILASLTTTPARRFGYSEHAGKIAKGYDADLVVLKDDPAKDATAFARIRYTIRKGMVIYESASQ